MKNLKKLIALFKKFRKIAIAVILLLAVVGGIIFLFIKEGRVFIDNSLISAPILNITAQIPGSLDEVDVVEGQSVQKGDQLAIVGTRVLRANTDGIIVSINKQTGLVSIIDPNDFRVVGTVDENKGLKDIRVGQVASFSVDAYPGETFWGYVDEISPTAEQTQAAFSISNERPTQQFNIFVRFDVSKYPQIKNGMSAKMTILTNTN